jgi:hypothetical protein
VGHRSAPIHQHADRPPDVEAQRRELAGELVGKQAVGGEMASVEALEGADLTCLEALGIAEDADGRVSWGIGLEGRGRLVSRLRTRRKVTQVVGVGR